jgi:predicted nuclease with TOPRIM domain
MKKKELEERITALDEEVQKLHERVSMLEQEEPRVRRIDIPRETSLLHPSLHEKIYVGRLFRMLFEYLDIELSIQDSLKIKKIERKVRDD